MFQISRSVGLLRRASAQQGRRFLHGDSPSRGRRNFLDLTMSAGLKADPRFGMDMTHAPGYKVAADEALPPEGVQKVADFAVRHARLTTDQVDQAHGYIWVGNVLYPTGVAPHDVTLSWFVSHDDESEYATLSEPDSSVQRDASGADNDSLSGSLDSKDSTPQTVQAKRRYTGGQVRRIRKERERFIAKRANRLTKGRPIRKPKNDIPDGEDV